MLGFDVGGGKARMPIGQSRQDLPAGPKQEFEGAEKE
jgi:hypothetical protein